MQNQNSDWIRRNVEKGDWLNDKRFENSETTQKKINLEIISTENKIFFYLTQLETSPDATNEEIRLTQRRSQKIMICKLSLTMLQKSFSFVKNTFNEIIVLVKSESYKCTNSKWDWKKVLFDQNFSMFSHICPVKNIESGLSLFWLQYFYARKKFGSFFYSAGVVLIFYSEHVCLSF